MSICESAAKPSIGVLRYSRIPRYGSDPFSLALVMMLLQVWIVFSTSAFNWGYIGLKVFNSNPQSLPNLLNSWDMNCLPLSDIMTWGIL